MTIEDDLPGLWSLEAKIMRVAWEQPETYLSVRRMLARLPGQPAYTTVMTVMGRLHQKGLLQRTRDGRAWSYRPATSEEAYAATTMAGALNAARDRKAALLHFLGDLTPDDAATLRRMLDRADQS
jgi:predicted transcriptional regulator